MVGTATSATRRLKTLDERPPPQAFARAGTLQLFSAEPEPGPAVPEIRNSVLRRLSRSATCRRVAVASSLALAVTAGSALAAHVQPDPEVPASSSSAPGESSTASGWASTRLSVGDHLEASAYFGQIKGIVEELDGTATFRVNPDYLVSYPSACALTVVFTGVEGETASAYAMDLGATWRAPEDPPSLRVSTDHGVIHHQMVAPPESVEAGTSWTLHSMIDVDGHRTSTDPYVLKLLKRERSELTWSFGDRTLTCSLV